AREPRPRVFAFEGSVAGSFRTGPTRACEQITFNAETAEPAEKKMLQDFSACSASSAFKRRIRGSHTFSLTRQPSQSWRSPRSFRRRAGSEAARFPEWSAAAH